MKTTIPSNTRTPNGEPGTLNLNHSPITPSLHYSNLTTFRQSHLSRAWPKGPGFVKQLILMSVIFLHRFLDIARKKFQIQIEMADLMANTLEQPAKSSQFRLLGL